MNHNCYIQFSFYWITYSECHKRINVITLQAHTLSCIIKFVSYNVETLTSNNPFVTFHMLSFVWQINCKLSCHLWRWVQRNVWNASQTRLSTIRDYMDLSQSSVIRWPVPGGPFWFPSLCLKTYILVRPWREQNRNVIGVQGARRGLWKRKGLPSGLSVSGSMWLWLSTLPHTVCIQSDNYVGIVSFWIDDIVPWICRSWTDHFLISITSVCVWLPVTFLNELLICCELR